MSARKDDAAEETAAADVSSSGYGPGGGSGAYERSWGGGGANDGRPRPDPILTQRFEALDGALHGPLQVTRRQALNWSGIDETIVAFSSIEEALAGFVPVDRPTSDLPQTYDDDRARG
jgi:hypothetical protein